MKIDKLTKSKIFEYLNDSTTKTSYVSINFIERKYKLTREEAEKIYWEWRKWYMSN